MAEQKTVTMLVKSSNDDPESPGILASRDGISPQHARYLVERHGSLVGLNPLPSDQESDPLNWPQRKKIINLLLVAFHAMIATFTAASIIPAFEEIAEDLGATIQRVSYLTSLQIAVLGGAPLFWNPISTKYGRRPIFLLSLICSLVCNIGCAESHSYGSLAASRALVAFFISPAAAIGTAVVAETFFKRERARYTGIWTLMVTTGIPLSALIFGFVVPRAGYRWIFKTLAIVNSVQFVLYLFLGPETRYLRDRDQNSPQISAFKREYMNLKRIDKTPFTAREFVEPLFLARSVSALIPAVAYSMIFLFCSILLTVEIPQLFAMKFNQGPQQLGLQFIGIIVGSLIGEQIGGTLSDYGMNSRSRKLGHPAPPEYRLWLAYPSYILAICGMVVFLVQIENAATYNVTPIIGAAIAAAGNQCLTTTVMTFIVDKHIDRSADVGVFVTFVRQTWGFIGPFWFPSMFSSVGLSGSAGIVTAMIVVGSVLPTILLHLRRKS